MDEEDRFDAGLLGDELLGGDPDVDEISEPPELPDEEEGI